MKLLHTFTVAIAIFLMAIVSTSQAEGEAASGEGNSTATTPGNKKNANWEDFFKHVKHQGNRRGHGHGNRHHFFPPGQNNKKHCACPLILKYVCGSDNTTYSNECDLKCQGVEKAHDGSCEDPNQHTPHPMHPNVKRMWGGGRRRRGRGRHGKHGKHGFMAKNGTEEAARSDTELAAKDEPEDGTSGESGSAEGGPEDSTPELPLPEPTPTE